jgi:glucose-6-phosphate-specific signal transduction histidine kinase
MASLAAVAALAIATLWGGWEWAMPCLIGLLVLWRVEFDFLSVLATLGCSFFWLSLYLWTGDRRMFFPYSIQIAVQMVCLLHGRMLMPAVLGGGSVIALFTMVRIAQSASIGVLAVELAVAAATLLIAGYTYGRSSQTLRDRVVAGTIGSLLAFGGLFV